MWYSEVVGALRSVRGLKRPDKAVCQSSPRRRGFRAGAHTRDPLKAGLGGTNLDVMSSNGGGSGPRGRRGGKLLPLGARLFNGLRFF